ncbi:ferredoxin [Desulfovulcanus sp.]
MPWIDEALCVGCGICVDECPDGFEMKNGKSVLKDPNASCVSKAMSVCPVGAIRPDSEKGTAGKAQSTVPSKVSGTGRGMGRGLGRGRGRGLGMGPRDGRGRGRGGGGRRR